MNIDYIHLELLKSGIDSYSSWLGKSDGPYMVCRHYNSKSKDAIASLIPIDDKDDSNFVSFIIKQLIHPLQT